MKELGVGIIAIVVGLAMLIGVIFGFIFAWQSIRVYVAEKGGAAEYARAEQNRRIKVLEAEAQNDAANLDAQAKIKRAKAESEAEIERARGVAEANKVIANSLQGNEAYLRYLWIDKLSDNQNVIYVPTEAGLPILEAGKR